MQLEGLRKKIKYKSKSNGCREDRVFVHCCNTYCYLFIFLPFDFILCQNPTHILVIYVKTLNRYALIYSTCTIGYVLGYLPHDLGIYLFFFLSFEKPSEYLVQNISELHAKLSRKSPQITFTR